MGKFYCLPEEGEPRMGLHILVADKRDIFRAGLRTILTKNSSVTQVVEAATSEELQGQLSSRSFDLIFVHQSLLIGEELLPSNQFVILADKPDAKVFQKAQNGHALGYLSEEVPETLLLSLFSLRKGQFLIDPGISQWALHSTDSLSAAIENDLFSNGYKATPALTAEYIKKILTSREQDVFALLCQGLTNPAIAEHLYISLTTVKTHTVHILHKLNMKRYEVRGLKCSNGIYIHDDQDGNETNQE